jgi:hypothetical protein
LKLLSAHTKHIKKDDISHSIFSNEEIGQELPEVTPVEITDPRNLLIEWGSSLVVEAGSLGF